MELGSGLGHGVPGEDMVDHVCTINGNGSTRMDDLTEPFPGSRPSFQENQTSRPTRLFTAMLYFATRQYLFACHRDVHRSIV